MTAGATTVTTIDLADLSARRLAEVGGKAANLGELIAAGFRVPDGFCLPTAAYRAATDGRLPASGAMVDAVATRTAVLAAPMPSPVRAAVEQAYARLGTDAAVAVRSSATAEDLPGASFAGQQDTYLNIVGRRERPRRGASVLGVAVDRPGRRLPGHPGHRRCRTWPSPSWCSGWSTPEVAGVLFTANPVTGRRRQAVHRRRAGAG